MYYVIERVSQAGDWDETKNILSDYFCEDLINITDSKLRNY